jgi:hypothetical protein
MDDCALSPHVGKEILRPADILIELVYCADNQADRGLNSLFGAVFLIPKTSFPFFEYTVLRSVFKQDKEPRSKLIF